MDLASRLQRELVRGSSVGLCAGAGPFDLPPGADFAGRFLGTLQDQESVDLLRDAICGPVEPRGSPKSERCVGKQCCTWPLS